MRNTGKLKSDSTLKSGGQLGGGGQLIPLKSLGSRKRLRARSEETQRVYEEERIPFVIDFLERHPLCSFKLWIHSTTLEESPPLDSQSRAVASCGRKAVDVHEIFPRGRGGNIVPIEGQDEDKQFLALCRWHHQWITSNPEASKRLGYTR